ncbi:MAG: hypothetical protein U9N09_01025 [Euryarchaeota archaeon]|nr:hypothetical protein [Euryarchaeota archaeon]
MAIECLIKSLRKHVCSSRNFAKRIHKLGIAVSLVGRSDTFVHAMRVGIKQMLQRAV